MRDKGKELVRKQNSKRWLRKDSPGKRYHEGDSQGDITVVVLR
jgi:hypothetical protein